MPVETIREQFQFLQTLSPQDCENFFKFCERTQIEAGKNLWEERDTDNFAAFILNGKLGNRVWRQARPHRHLHPRSVVGEICLLTSNPRSVTAEVIEPSEVLLLHSQHFEELLQQFPILELALLRHVFIATSKRLTKSCGRLDVLTKRLLP